MAVMQVPRSEEAPPTLVIEKRGAGLTSTWSELWAYRHLVRYLAGRELKGRYRALTLGKAWFLIRPLSEMLVYVLIFGVVLKLHRGDLPYPLYVYSGLICWLFFATATNRVSQSFAAFRGMMTKVYFPRLIPPLVAITVELADFGAAFLFALVLLAVYLVAPGLGVLTLPLWVALLLIWTAGIGLFAAATSVKHRDVTMVLAIFLRVWMYTTPVIYPMSFIPERWLWLYRLNPMAVIVEGFRASLTNEPLPPLGAIIWTAATGICMALFALRLYRRTERDIVDHF